MVRFNFGKYKGMLVADVVRSNPQYVIWAHKNVEFFKCDKRILAQAFRDVANQWTETRAEHNSWRYPSSEHRNLEHCDEHTSGMYAEAESRSLGMGGL